MRRTLAILAFGAAAGLFVLTLAGYAGRWGPALEVIANFRLHRFWRACWAWSWASPDCAAAPGSPC